MGVMVLHGDGRHAEPFGGLQRQPGAEEVGVQVMRHGLDGMALRPGQRQNSIHRGLQVGAGLHVGQIAMGIRPEHLRAGHQAGFVFQVGAQGEHASGQRPGQRLRRRGRGCPGDGASHLA